MASIRSINDLESLLKKLDSTAAPESRLEGYAFEKTFNESLGLSGNVADFVVFIPWRSWPQATFKDTHYPSALQEAFKDVLSKGADKSNCFLDIVTLNPHEIFFNESTDPQNPVDSVAHALAEVIDQTDDSVTPIIRLLAGSEDNKTADQFWNDNRKKFENIFWRDGKPLVKKNKKAKLYVGYYSPSFKIDSAPEVVRWTNYLRDILKAVALPFKALESIPFLGLGKGLATNISTAIEGLDDQFINAYLTKAILPAISWNHAKLLAVNGKTMMTGGGNYWGEYQGNAHDIFDHQVKVKGDAAISAHKYSDYFWRYLHELPNTDDHSFQRSISLNSEDNLEWSTSDKAPFTNPFKPSSPQGKFPVLTVSRLGDWHGPMNDINYPIQFVDAIRDMLLNIVWQAGVGTSSSSEKALGDLIIKSTQMLRDDGSFISDYVYTMLGINPAAWSTRYARTKAIAAATQSVYISQQTLVNYLQVGNGAFDGVVRQINKSLSLDKDPIKNWNGYVWPFDLLVAIASALINMRTLNTPNSGVFVALTTKKANGARGGWEDWTPASKIKDRVRIILKGMPAHLSDSEIQKLVDEKFRIKRVLNDDGRDYLHTKVIVTDRQLMFAGSDNAYPNYNEEHGIWIEDRATIDHWFADFWDGLWSRSTEVDREDFKMKGV